VDLFFPSALYVCLIFPSALSVRLIFLSALSVSHLPEDNKIFNKQTLAASRADCRVPGVFSFLDMN
jgi:hypothetical protein